MLKASHTVHSCPAQAAGLPHVHSRPDKCPDPQCNVEKLQQPDLPVPEDLVSRIELAARLQGAEYLAPQRESKQVTQTGWFGICQKDKESLSHDGLSNWCSLLRLPHNPTTDVHGFAHMTLAPSPCHFQS